MLSQPRLLAAFGLYQACFANISHLQLVDTQMGELQRPVQLGAFLALQRLHLENMAEMLQTEWVMKVRGTTLMHVDADNGSRPSSGATRHNTQYKTCTVT
jgi:hypothetical protein